jgi:hypothetical protein
MVDDVVTPLNPLIALIEKEMLEKTSLDVNVSQRLRDEDPFQKVVHIRVDHSTWDYRSSLNPHALTIYLKFVPTHGAMLKRFKECQCEDDDVRFHCQTWVLNDSDYYWLRGLINPLPMEC